LVVALQRSRVMANSQHPIANELQIPTTNDGRMCYESLSMIAEKILTSSPAS
jgi:hypothetical protein